VNKIDQLQPFIRGSVLQLSLKKNYNPSKKNGRIFCKPSWWKVFFKLLVPDPMCYPTSGIFMVSNTLKRLRWNPVCNLRESSWPQLPSIDSSETQPLLIYRDGGCYAIRYHWETVLNPCLHCRVGDTEWSRDSIKVFFHNLHCVGLHQAEE
jgi:hypothetical protein